MVTELLTLANMLVHTDDGGGGFPWWTSLLTPPVLITTGIVVVVLIVAVAVTARVLYKRVRRSPALADALLRARANYTNGPQQDVLKLRVRLRDTLDSGQAAVDLSLRSTGPQGELPSLFRSIQREGVALESQLRLMESETDTSVLAQGIPVATRRVDDVTALVRRLRGAIASDLGALTDSSLSELRADVDREVAALHAGVQELQSLNGSDQTALPSTDRPTQRDQR
ncbi:MAG: hypothetical protein KGR99_10475 [Betaproteobacteria bacterium]|nr:hypothetical protein [Betaproteobacteria bacterium]